MGSWLFFFCQCSQLSGCECWNWVTHVTRYGNGVSVFWLKVAFLDGNTVKSHWTLGMFLFSYAILQFGMLPSCIDQAAVWTTEYLDFLQRARYCSLRHNVRCGSGTSQQLYEEVKRPWRVANHSPAFSVEIKNECSCKFTSVSSFVVVASLGATWRLGYFAELLARGD
jgi:hypothetical protein